MNSNILLLANYISFTSFAFSSLSHGNYKCLWTIIPLIHFMDATAKTKAVLEWNVMREKLTYVQEWHKWNGMCLEYSEHLRQAYLQLEACLQLYTAMNKISVKYQLNTQNLSWGNNTKQMEQNVPLQYENACILEVNMKLLCSTHNLYCYLALLPSL